MGQNLYNVKGRRATQRVARTRVCHDSSGLPLQFVLDFDSTKFYLKYMRKPLSSTLLLLALFATIAQGAVIKGVSGYSNGTNITVRWQSEDESGVIGYEIARKSGTVTTFLVLAPSLPTRGSGASYEFIDETAFRVSDSYYQYRITAIYGDGHRSSDPSYVTVTHSVSSVRRTWGSIKAMFR
jgi:hypothetical protein